MLAFIQIRNSLNRETPESSKEISFQNQTYRFADIQKIPWYVKFGAVLNSNVFIDRGDPQEGTGRIDQGGLFKALAEIGLFAGLKVNLEVKVIY